MKRTAGDSMRWDDFEVERIGEAFYVVRQSKGSNIGICVKDGSALIVDSGYLPTKSASLVRLLEKNLRCRVKLLFNTHYHSDHTFGNQSFKCTILSSEECRSIMEENLSTHWSPEEISKAKEEDPELMEEWKDLEITRPTTTFKEQHSYDFKGVRVVFQKLGGHSKDSSIAYFPDYKIVFSGDNVFGQCYPALLSHDCSPSELIKTLQIIMDMDVKIIIPGHGMTCDKKMARELINYWECLNTQCREMLASGMDDEGIQEILTKCCHLPNMPLNERKHKRNIGSVLKFTEEHQV